MKLPKTLLELVDNFSKIPGIGEKTAIRQALILSKWNESDLTNFGQSIAALSTMKRCKTCGMLTDNETCEVCSSPSRFESKMICIVENISECIAIERGGHFTGKYHILGGIINPLMGVGPDQINLASLERRVIVEDVKEILLAISPSVEGDATCAYIKQIIPDHISVERIGLGIPMGGNLEYLDSLTISKAIENRRSL